MPSSSRSGSGPGAGAPPGGRPPGGRGPSGGRPPGGGSNGPPDDEGPALDYPRCFDEAMAHFLHLVLLEVARRGMPEPHRLLIGFRTRFPGVLIPARLTREYPDSMRIILQHRFSDLASDGEFFSVTLEFGGRSERLSVPYAAVTEFTDPEVPLGYRFARMQRDDEGDAANRPPEEGRARTGPPASATPFPGPRGRPRLAPSAPGPAAAPKGGARVVDLSSRRPRGGGKGKGGPPPGPKEPA